MLFKLFQTMFAFELLIKTNIGYTQIFIIERKYAKLEKV